MVKAERYEMKPLFNGVCKCQKWVENANQFDIHHDISLGGVNKFLGGGVKKIWAQLKIFTPPTGSLCPPLPPCTSKFDYSYDYTRPPDTSKFDYSYDYTRPTCTSKFDYSYDYTRPPCTSKFLYRFGSCTDRTSVFSFSRTKMEDTNKMNEKKEMKVKKIKASRSMLDVAAYLVAKNRIHDSDDLWFGEENKVGYSWGK